MRIPSLGEALPRRFAQEDLFPAVDPADSALTLMGSGLRDAVSGDTDSEGYDSPLLRSFGEFKEVFRHGVASIEMRNGRPDQGPLVVTPEGMRVVERLQRQTPRPQRVRVAGKVDAIRHSDHAFTLVLSSGEQIRGVLADEVPDALAAHFGKLSIVSGTAQFRPSGSLLRVDADHLEPADEADLALWSFSPQPRFAASIAREPRRSQTSRSGVSALLGAWPGDETDEEIFADPRGNVAIAGGAHLLLDTSIVLLLTRRGAAGQRLDDRFRLSARKSVPLTR